MENSISRMGAFCPGLDRSATELKKSLFLATVRENPVFFILHSVRESLKGESEEKIVKALAKTSFIMLDGIESKIRYEMKKGRKEALAYENPVKKCKETDSDIRRLVINTYSLTIRRARRKREILALILESIERFYAQNRYEYEDLLEVLVSGARGLSHIDIMISLYEEEMMFYCSS